MGSPKFSLDEAFDQPCRDAQGCSETRSPFTASFRFSKAYEPLRELTGPEDIREIFDIILAKCGDG